MTMNPRRVATVESPINSSVAKQRGFERLVDQALKRLAKLTCRYAAESALLFYHYPYFLADLVFDALPRLAVLGLCRDWLMVESLRGLPGGLGSKASTSFLKRSFLPPTSTTVNL